MTSDRLVTPARVDEEAQDEAGLRPRRLDEYIGQDRIRENLQVATAAARLRAEPLDHVLLHGPPGLGKTTLAYVIANEMGVPVRATSGPAIEKPGDLVGIVTSLARGEVLFHEGDPGDQLYVVVEGKIKLGRTSGDGRENLTAVMGPGEMFGEQDRDGLHVHHDLTQEELAQLVGASRETVNKALADFAARGWLQISARSVLILDIERLRRRARLLPLFMIVHSFGQHLSLSVHDHGSASER